MKPAALLSATAFAVLTLCLQPVSAQIIQTRYEVLPVRSAIYNQTVNVLVYTSPAAPAGEAAMPVVYVPLLAAKDSACLMRLEQMMQQGTLPYMRMVAVDRVARVAPASAATPAVYINPKGRDDAGPSGDESFCRFLNSEVVPAVEGKYKCNTFKALYIDETTPLGGYMLANHLRSFNAYLSPEAFVWFSEGRRPELAKTFRTYYSGQRAQEAIMVAAEVDRFFDEYFLKTGKVPWQKQ